MPRNTDIDVLVVGSDGAAVALANDDRLRSHSVTDHRHALEAARDSSVECVLVDHRVEAAVPPLVARLREARPALPVFLVGGSGDLAEDALEAGATDVLREDERSAVVANRVANAVERGRETTPSRGGPRLDALLEHSTDRISVLDEEARYTFVSPAVERLMGYEPGELLGESGLEYVHPDDRDRVAEAFERALAEPDETHAVEYRIRDADGEWCWVASRGTNHLDDPAVGGIVLNSREITDRKRRQRRLSEERAFTESIFAALPDVFYAVDEDGNFLRWNDRFSAVTGYDDAEIESMRPTELIAPDDREAVAEAIATVFEEDTSVTVEARFETKDGERIPYEFTGKAVTGPDGELISLVGIGRDVSKRKERRRRFEAVFNNTYQFIGLLDTDGTLLEANETALEFGGMDRDDVVGQKLWDAEWFQTDEAGRAAREAVETARSGALYREEITVHGAEGTETIDFSVRPVTDEHGEVALLIPEGRLITELKRRERHLKVLHRFLRHNFRNKMTVIAGTADAMGRIVEDPDLEAYVDKVAGAANELNELSETAYQLSQVAIEGRGELQPVALERTLADVADSICARYPEASVHVDAVGDVAVRADWRLETVFEQLVENAVEHVERDDSTVDLRVDRGDDVVSVRIVDDGPGIPEDELAGITTDEEPTQLTHGTGFGLWLVRSVVDDYGGDLDYDSRGDGGSIVTVELPRAAGDDAAESRRST